MSMYCNQCQETAKNIACTQRGVCGKTDNVANLQDLLIYILQGIALYSEKLNYKLEKEQGTFIAQALFATITNTNFDEDKIVTLIEKALIVRDQVKNHVSESINHDAANWSGRGKEAFLEKAKEVGILTYSDNEDIRSLKTLILFGIKGAAAYTDHASVLGFYDEELGTFFARALAAIAKDLQVDTLIDLVIETGAISVKAMALLDKANTSSYGNPELTKVNMGVKNNPGILVSGHDLKDLEEILKQTKGQGVDVYTHGEMLPANYYPAFKKYEHFVGNYGSSWWKQSEEFESFNGPIIMTTNCITPVRDSYRDRIFTTGMAGYAGVKLSLTEVEAGQKIFLA